MKLLYKIFIFLSFISVAQTNTESLIVVQYDAQSTTDVKQHIYKYVFVNNSYANREKIITVIGRQNQKDYVRFDRGENTIYRNRYLISSFGSILDLQQKKVLFDGTAQLLKCSNDSVIFYTNDIFKGKFYSYFDLKNNIYSEIKSLTFKLNVDQAVEFDRSQSPYKLYYYPLHGPKVLLMDDAGHGGISSTYKLGGIPIYWLNNNTFIFPNVKIPNSEGAIVKYNLTTKSFKEIGTFNSSSTLVSKYKIQKSIHNSIVEFYFKDKLYVIDLLKETMVNSSFKDVENDYSIEFGDKPSGRLILLKGKQIGKMSFEILNFKSSTHYAAILNEIIIGEESYQQGLSVYNVNTLKWENVDAENVASLAGWIIN